RLQIGGIHVRPARRYDHFLLAPLEVKIAGLIERANVARAVPTLVVGDTCIRNTFIRSCLRVARAPISRRHDSAPHQNLPVFRQLHLAPRQHFANRSLSQPERMVHADQRSRLGQPISLDRRIAEPSPELLSLAVERGAAGNKCPELPAELPANFAKRPPESQVVLLLGWLKPPPASLPLSAVLQIAFDLLLQRLQHTGHTYQNRYALSPDRMDHFRRLQLFLKNYRRAQQRRQKHSQKLPKHMAQRQEVQKPQRMHEPLILHAPPHLALQRRNVREDIPMGDQHSLGFRRRARREDNLQRVIAPESDIKRLGALAARHLRQIFQIQGRNRMSRRRALVHVPP